MESTWWWQRSLLRLASFQTESSQSAADRGARVVSYVVVFREHISPPRYCDKTFGNVNSELFSVSFWERNNKKKKFTIFACFGLHCNFVSSRIVLWLRKFRVFRESIVSSWLRKNRKFFLRESFHCSLHALSLNVNTCFPFVN